MPMRTNIDPVEKLNELVQLDADAIQLYAKAIEHVDDPVVKRDLEQFKADHGRHISDLGQVIVELGGSAETPTTDIKGALLEVFTTIRSVTGTIGALKAMRLNERLTNLVYDKAIKLGLPEPAMRVIEHNRDDERRHLAAIEGHLDRLGKHDKSTPARGKAAASGPVDTSRNAGQSAGDKAAESPTPAVSAEEEAALDAAIEELLEDTTTDSEGERVVVVIAETDEEEIVIVPEPPRPHR